MKLTKVKTSGLVIKKNHELTIQKLKEAKELMDDPEALSAFDATDEAMSGEKLKESMDALIGHCEKEAKPAFAKISSLDLSPLCEFGGAGATQSVVETVAQRKAEVKKELKECQGWWVDYEIPDSAEKDNSELTEPELLSTVVEEYPEVAFASAYMPKWKTGGPFLSAIAALRQLLREVESETGALKDKIRDLALEVEANANMMKDAMNEVQKAIAED